MGIVACTGGGAALKCLAPPPRLEARSADERLEYTTLNSIFQGYMVKPKKYDNVVKEYPDMYRVVSYKYGYTPQKKQTTKDRIKKAMDAVSESLSLENSVNRSKNILHDYVRCNDFDLFVTFTFSPKKVNRYSMQDVYPKMVSWLNNQRRKNPELKYIVVPEKHKDGAIHFHALFENATFALKKAPVIVDGQRAYNITSFRFGFTRATKMDPKDKEKCGNYIAKYITKDMTTLTGKRRYWASKNLALPVVTYNDFRFSQFTDHKTKIIDGEYVNVYHVPKDLLD